MRFPEISIIIPAFGRKEVLGKCLNSILASEGIENKFSGEIIIVDDSPSECIKILTKSIDHSDLKINYLRGHNNGVASARNMGIKKSSHDLLFMIDSDISLRRETLLKGLKLLRERKKIGAVCGKTIKREDGKVNINFPKPFHDRFEYHGNKYIEGFFGGFTLIYKKILKKIGCYDPSFMNYGENMDLSKRLWCAGYPVGYSPKIITKHLSTSFSLSGGKTKTKLRFLYAFSIFAQKYRGDPGFPGDFIKFLCKIKSDFDREEIRLAIPYLIKRSHNLLKSLRTERRRNPIHFQLGPFNLFSEKEELLNCIKTSERRLKPIREKVFSRE